MSLAAIESLMRIGKSIVAWLSALRPVAANQQIESGHSLVPGSGLAGALIGAVFNFALASSLIWQRKPQRSRRAVSLPVGELSRPARAPEPNRIKGS
jgi:hypothetical protein